MKHIQNNQKSIGKSTPAYGFKNLKKIIRGPTVMRLLLNVWDFQKEKQILWYGCINL